MFITMYTFPSSHPKDAGLYACLFSKKKGCRIQFASMVRCIPWAGFRRGIPETTGYPGMRFRQGMPETRQ